MSFVSSFPADFDRVQRDTRNAAINADLDAFWNSFPKVFTTAHMLKGDATGLIEHAQSAIGKQMRSKSKTGEKLARASVQSVNAAIKAADAAIRDRTDESLQKATKMLNEANMKIDKALKYEPKKHSMTTRRGIRKGGTLRRKHRKSVKRYKS